MLINSWEIFKTCVGFCTKIIYFDTDDYKKSRPIKGGFFIFWISDGYYLLTRKTSHAQRPDCTP